MGNNFDAFNAPNMEYAGYVYENAAGNIVTQSVSATSIPGTPNFGIPQYSAPAGYQLVAIVHTHDDFDVGDDNPGGSDAIDQYTLNHFSVADENLAKADGVPIYVGVDVTSSDGTLVRNWYSWDPATGKETLHGKLPDGGLKC
ncbi:MAG TPA: DUF4329 domain-containing protein [Candidatus Acidoferrales bacterium]|nr:DUF4329 domain-containing protein [Candidatus Acidoferrales bacterium]